MNRQGKKPKIRKAVALSYNASRDYAPKVIAKGSAFMAERIVALAREHGVPLQQDPQLVEVLAALDLDREIPPELYRAVAEILAFVYSLTKEEAAGTA